MIDGLKLTFSGAELRTVLEAQVERHEQHAERWAREQKRTPEDATEDEPLLPDHICENEAARHAWRAEALQFIRDHIEPAETYRLGAADLEFGELLPCQPGSLEQNEYEERTRMPFTVERLAKALERLVGSTEGWLAIRNVAAAAGRGPEILPTTDETGEFRTRRLETEDGPEIVIVERK